MSATAASNGDVSLIANARVKEISVQAHSVDADAVIKQYTTWVQTGDYDVEMVEGLGYTVPGEISKFIQAYLPDTPDAKILDAGAGTGLVGQVCHDAGGRNITACDLTPAMLDVARTRLVYDAFEIADLNKPLSFANDAFSLLLCGGTLTWINEAELVMNEFIRVCKPGAHIIFTHRTDTYEKFGYAAIQRGLVDSGRWKLVKETEPLPYLPDQDEFKAQQLLVKFFVYQKAHVHD
jgi:predicted TPR repeat methyltransferase